MTSYQEGAARLSRCRVYLAYCKLDRILAKTAAFLREIAETARQWLTPIVFPMEIILFNAGWPASDYSSLVYSH